MYGSISQKNRAQKRMDGEDVFGHKIQVSHPVRIAEKEESPRKNQNGKRFQANGGRENFSRWSNTYFHPSSMYHAPAAFNFLSSGMNHPPYNGNWSLYGNTSSVNVAQEYYTGVYAGFHGPVEVSTSVPFAGFGGQNPSNLFPFPRKPQAELLSVPSGVVDRVPKGLRKIKGLVPFDHESYEIEVNQYAANSFSERSFSARAYVKAGPSDIPPQVQPDIKSPSPCGIPLDINSKMKSTSKKEHVFGASHTPSSASKHYDADLDEPEHFFHPISTSDHLQMNGSNDPVELHVSNLDHTFGAREMKKILLNAFKEHVMVLHLLVLVQQDGSLNAVVKLASQQDAQYAIYKLQRHKIGHKRIRISHGSVNRQSPQLIRSQVISLLQEVPNHRLPLFKFCELYENRFLCSISVSDIYKIKECDVSNSLKGRIVSLIVDVRNSPSPQLQILQEMEVLEPPFCPLHGHEMQPNRGWAEQEVLSLPFVNISLKLLAVRIHALLQTHNGSVHLNSLPLCYQAQFEVLPEDKDGVALEHLVSCVPGVEIFNSPANIKYLRWAKVGSVSSRSSKTDEDTVKGSASLAGKLAVFSRELVDLLKTSPHCQIPFDKFIPAYHHHFGRQCRVADYGFTKLIELLEFLPHTVQVLGERNKRTVTLSHHKQLRRFTGDLLRVLRGQMNKEVLLSDLPCVFEKVFNKPLIITNYGVCDIHDLLSDLSDASVVVTPISGSNDMLIAIPKREQLPNEVEKTRQFAAEVIELLRHAPNCTIQFNKFIPAHHVHFGWQCRVADYGFTKLIELFEAVPDVVQIKNLDGERWVSLTKKEHLKVLTEQIAALLQFSPQNTLSLAALKNNFRIEFGYSLRPESFGCSNVEELLGLLSDTIKVEELEGRLMARLESSYVQDQFIRDIQKLVVEAGGSLPLSSVESLYVQKYGRPCNPVQFGYTSLGALLHAMRSAVRLRGRGTKRYIVLADTFCSSAAVTPDIATSTADMTRISNALRYSTVSTTITVPDFRDDSSSANDGDSGHDDESSTSAVDDSSLSSGSKIHSSERSSASEMVSDVCASNNSRDPIGHAKIETPEKGDVEGFHTDDSSVWCVTSPPWASSFKSPWRTHHPLNVTDSPAVMLSPSSNLLPAFSTHKKSSNLAMCHLPPLYSYPPFLPGHVASPEPSALPLPQLSLAAPWLSSQDVSSVNDNSNTSTPNKVKGKRRLAAQFNTPLDLP